LTYNYLFEITTKFSRLYSIMKKMDYYEIWINLLIIRLAKNFALPQEDIMSR